jgi:hypothetical protein
VSHFFSFAAGGAQNANVIVTLLPKGSAADAAADPARVNALLRTIPDLRGGG